MSKILVVDDEAPILQMLTHMLNKEGYDIETAENGEDALEKLHNYEADLIITDILMPKMDGIDFAVQVKQDYPEVRIIAISGGRRNISADFNLNTVSLVGVDEVLKKPFDSRQLLTAVSKLLSV